MTTPANRASPADAARRLLAEVPVGVRVTVRSLLPDGSATDAVGDLLARDAESVTIRTRRRGELTVRLDDVVAARRVG